MPSIERRIVLTKGPPWGFRLYVDNKGVLTISKIRRHSPAETAKLHAGDQLVSLNGRSTRHMGHAEAVGIIDTTVGTLDILVSRFESTSTKVLMFDKVDSRLPNDVSTNINVKLASKEASPAVEYGEEMYDNENYFMSEPSEKDASPVVEKPEPFVNQEVIEPEQEEPVEEVNNNFIIEPDSDEVDEIKPVPINKLIKEYDITNNNNDGDFQSDKKHFGDSAFYNDPQNLYPTMEEQISMARKVACSLTAPDNISSRGASIFERQRRRAEKHTVENEPKLSSHVYSSSNDGLSPPKDLAHWPHMPSAIISRDKSPSPVYRLGYTPGPPPPPPPPTGPPPPPNETRTLPEFLEKARQFPRSKHDAVTPNICHDIAAALHSSNSRGAQLFAMKKSRSKKWEVSAPEPQAASAEPVMAAVPGPSFNSSIQQKSKPRVVSIVRNQNNGNAPGFGGGAYSSQPHPINMTSTNQVSAAPAAAAPPPSVSSTPSSNNKWKPVKFNVPQRA